MSKQIKERLQGVPGCGVMICGHGSRSQSAVSEFTNMVKQLKAALAPVPVSFGFLEFATPIIADGLRELADQGVTHVLAIPGMLMAAGHAKNDIPSVLNTQSQKFPDMKIEYGRELAIDPQMLQAASFRIEEALQANNIAKSELADCLLVVVGRGASDPDANANISKVTRMLWEGFGFGWAETVYSGVTFPLVQPGLRHAARLGYKRILVFPYFLFSGILIDRIYEHTDLCAEELPDIEFIKVGYLHDHPKVIATMMDRIVEIIDGENKMNCQMCKYRTQILGFEDEVGLAQESHHHHVEGINDHGHDHDHNHAHDHDHGHHPYPHADHPLGPRTLPKSD